MIRYNYMHVSVCLIIESRISIQYYNDVTSLIVTVLNQRMQAAEKYLNSIIIGWNAECRKPSIFSKTA